MTLGHTKLLLLASAATLLVAGLPARAADVPAAAPVVEKHGHDWDIAFGVTIVSDYQSRGYTQTDGGPAVQPWAELTINDCFYVGYWGSNVGTGATAGWESDLSVGVRPKWGPVSFDFGYVRYIYSNQAFSADSSDIYAKASYSPFEPVTLGGAAFYNLDNKNTYLEANVAVALHANITASAAYGWNTYGNGNPSDTGWNIGVSWAPQDWVKVDGRYYGGPTANKFVVGLTFQTSVKKLGIH